MRFLRFFFAAAIVSLLSPSPLAALLQDNFGFTVTVRDAEQKTIIVGATILDIVTNELVTTDSNGQADFLHRYAPESTPILQISAPGYPEHFRKVAFPGLDSAETCGPDPSWVMTLDLPSEKTYLSPPIGPLGGDRVIHHPTGQLIYPGTDYSGTPKELLQRVKVVVPAGALSGQYRIGFTPFLARSYNNAFFETVATQNVRPIAQFRIGLYDLNGDYVASPTFNPPIRVEISSGSILSEATISTGMLVGFRHFDEAMMSWDESGIASSGTIAASASAFVELEHFSTYCLFDLEPQSSGDCYWHTISSNPLPCKSPNGIAVDQSIVTCGEGAAGTGPVTLDEESELTQEDSTGGGIDVGLSEHLGSLGFSISRKSSSRKTWTKSVKRVKTIPTGEDPAYKRVEQTGVDENGDPVYEVVKLSGTVYIRTMMTSLMFGRYCPGQGLLPVEIRYYDFVSGLCLDTSQLVDGNCD